LVELAKVIFSLEEGRERDGERRRRGGGGGSRKNGEGRGKKRTNFLSNLPAKSKNKAPRARAKKSIEAVTNKSVSVALRSGHPSTTNN
jgi:hypothetical protein